MKKKLVVFEKDELDFIIDYERYRTDISKISFSLICLSPSNTSNNSKISEKLVNNLYKSLRIMDVIGYINKSKLFILLPSTSYQDSHLFLKKLQDSIKNYSTIIKSQEIFTYPDNWFDIDNLKYKAYYADKN